GEEADGDDVVARLHLLRDLLLEVGEDLGRVAKEPVGVLLVELVAAVAAELLDRAALVQHERVGLEGVLRVEPLVAMLDPLAEQAREGGLGRGRVRRGRVGRGRAANRGERREERERKPGVPMHAAPPSGGGGSGAPAGGFYYAAPAAAAGRGLTGLEKLVN